MLIIPAVDLKGGKCVRLVHGEAKKETIYSDNPAEMAAKWVGAGTRRLHVIDLDGAFEGESKNLEWVLRIKKETGVKVQMGGGLRTFEAISKILDAGIDYVILGTIVFTDPELTKKVFDAYKERIIVAMDARGGDVTIKGWTANAGVTVDEALKNIKALGGREVIYTDIGRDGTLKGVNVEATKEAMSKTDLTIYASGGVSSLDDIDKLLAIDSPGCIVGKALYEGQFDLVKAFEKVHAHAR